MPKILCAYCYNSWTSQCRRWGYATDLRCYFYRDVRGQPVSHGTMSNKIDESSIRKIVREEIAKYMDRDFRDDEHLMRDMKLLSDDLTAIALTIEKRLGLKIQRGLYPRINNVSDYVQVIQEAL